MPTRITLAILMGALLDTTSPPSNPLSFLEPQWFDRALHLICAPRLAWQSMVVRLVAFVKLNLIGCEEYDSGMKFVDIGQFRLICGIRA